MAETYKKESLINILSDNFRVDKGGVSVDINTNQLVVKNDSRCTFSYNYADYELKETSNIRIEYDIECDNVDFSTRYNNNIEIIIRIRFSKIEYDAGENKFVDDCVQTISILPYTKDEYKGAYKNEEISLSGKYIKSMDVIFNFYNSDNTVTEIYVNKLNIFMSVSIDESAVEKYVNDYLHNNTVALVIPVVDKLPNIEETPTGAIFLVRKAVE